MIPVQALQRFAPHCNAVAWAPALEAACTRFAIDTPDRVAQFMAQTGEESGLYTVFEENLNYSAGALLAQWPNHFPTQAIAASYARQPAKIANRAYAGRYGNGDEASGDGWRFRGRGPIQITFQAGYVATKAQIGLDCVADPDLLLQPAPGALSAGGYWASRGCNALADAGAIIAITKAVNGGLINLDRREANLDAWRAAVAA